MITFPIKCFGVFRQFGDKLCVAVNPGSSVLQIKAALVQQLGQQHKTLVEEFLPMIMQFCKIPIFYRKKRLFPFYHQFVGGEL
jgi:hypothetical protein